MPLFCPLRGFHRYPDTGRVEGEHCLESDCAWWDKIDDRCSVISIDHSINALAYECLTIQEKLKPELFRTH